MFLALCLMYQMHEKQVSFSKILLSNSEPSLKVFWASQLQDGLKMIRMLACIAYKLGLSCSKHGRTNTTQDTRAIENYRYLMPIGHNVEVDVKYCISQILSGW